MKTMVSFIAFITNHFYKKVINFPWIFGFYNILILFTVTAMHETFLFIKVQWCCPLYLST